MGRTTEEVNFALYGSFDLKKSFTVRGEMAKRMVLVLIDSVASHNLISRKLLWLQTESTISF